MHFCGLVVYLSGYGPYCAQCVEICLEDDLEGSFVQDCEVCCNPWQITVEGQLGHRRVDVQRVQ